MSNLKCLCELSASDTITVTWVYPSAMQVRQTIIEQFSAFIELADNRFKRWLVDPHLNRSMAHALAQMPDGGGRPHFWTVYWYKCWKTQPTGRAYYHLMAFVQESCYWAAHKIAVGFASTQYSLADCFQVAIAGLPNILKHFSPDRGAKLDTYARMAFSNIIRDTLRQRKETDICTDWALLRKVSQKRLNEALAAAGVGPEQRQQYVLAWQGFKVLYVPQQSRGTQQLGRPDDDTWEAIAQYFNQNFNQNFKQNFKQHSSPLTLVSPTISPKTLQQWLQKCAAAIRAYLYPAATSLNRPKPGADTGEWQDSLMNPDDLTPFDALVADETVAERQQQQQDIQGVLADTVQKLPPEAQAILDCYYRQGQTQQAIAKTLNVKQYSVSRRLSKVRATLLKNCATWSQDTLHISLTSDVLKRIELVIEEWLRCYYTVAHGQEDG